MPKYLLLNRCKECGLGKIKEHAAFFCSKTCSNRYNARRPEVHAKVGRKAKIPILAQDRVKSCETCKNIIPHYKKESISYYVTKKRYCSKKCNITLLTSSKTKKEKNVNWKGGISYIKKPEREILWASTPYKHWRKTIFERDQYICQNCGQTNCGLHAHHIKIYRDYPALALNIENGITLCYNCHTEVHRVLRKNPDNWESATQGRLNGVSDSCRNF